MMFALSDYSLNRLLGAHPDLVRLVHAVMEMQIMDFGVEEGLRTNERQRELIAQGRSTTMNSKHLVQADGYGHAVDLSPYPLDWDKVNKGDWRECSRFGVLAGLMKAKAKELGISIVWGNDWDSDGQTLDHTFNDAPHFQLGENK
jgi:peptidoglycan LD-endopeptidase CwlK